MKHLKLSERAGTAMHSRPIHSRTPGSPYKPVETAPGTPRLAPIVGTVEVRGGEA
jgi:hypothetical protein